MNRDSFPRLETPKTNLPILKTTGRANQQRQQKQNLRPSLTGSSATAPNTPRREARIFLGLFPGLFLGLLFHFAIFSYSDLNIRLNAYPAAFLAVLPEISVLLLCLLLYYTLATNGSRNNGSRVPFSLTSSSLASTPPLLGSFNLDQIVEYPFQHATVISYPDYILRGLSFRLIGLSSRSR